MHCKSYLHYRLWVSTALLLLSISGWAWAGDHTTNPLTNLNSKNNIPTNSFMVATANHYASKIAAQIIQHGGNAVDAAITATMVLTLVEPQSSGLGGGCFTLYWDQEKKKLFSFDGRETAPQTASGDLFIDQGKPLDFQQAVASGRAVGVPGQLHSLYLLHRRHGKLPWKDLFVEPIRLAEEGFIVSARLAGLLQKKRHQNKLQRNPTAAIYFFPDGQPIAVGDLLKNPALGRSLRWIAHTGASAFYRGMIAHSIVNAVQQEPNPGQLSAKDMALYQSRIRQPVCAPYAGHRVCSIGPPSSGGITLLQILGLLEQTDIAKQRPLSIDAIHLFSQASRLAFADRNHYLADTDYVPLPVLTLLDPEYLKRRADLLNPKIDMGKAQAGSPFTDSSLSYQPGNNLEESGTSHISIIDTEGNAVALTASIEQAFGSGIMTSGFLLNNELTDFSFRSNDQDGRLIANRPQGGKRPRSSMTPTMVFDHQQRLKIVLGSPGGSRIIPYVAQTLLGLLNWQMDIQQAINQPHYLHRNGRTIDLERNTKAETMAKALKKRGYQVKIRNLNSGLQGIIVTKDGLEGGVDPRREGLVIGE